MVPGMVFTIEPMVNLGKPDIYLDDENGWTIYTEDGKPSAQWEVTVPLRRMAVKYWHINCLRRQAGPGYSGLEYPGAF